MKSIAWAIIIAAMIWERSYQKANGIENTDVNPGFTAAVYTITILSFFVSLAL